VSPTSIRNATIVPIAIVDSVTPSRSASNQDPDLRVRPHRGGHHKKGKTDSHHDAAVGDV
jgi:hypothetical protein